LIGDNPQFGMVNRFGSNSYTCKHMYISI